MTKQVQLTFYRTHTGLKGSGCPSGSADIFLGAKESQLAPAVMPASLMQLNPACLLPCPLLRLKHTSTKLASDQTLQLQQISGHLAVFLRPPVSVASCNCTNHDILPVDAGINSVDKLHCTLVCASYIACIVLSSQSWVQFCPFC